MEPFEYIGEWWLESDEENTKVGTLSFSSEEGVILELIGSFEELALDTNIRTYPTIFGISKNGKFITLVACTEVGSTSSWPGIPTQKLSCNVAYLGRQHLSDDNRLFSKVLIGYSYLLEWLHLSGFEYDLTTQNDSLIEYNLTFKHPEEVKSTIPNGTVTTKHIFEMNPTLREVRNTQKVYLQVESENQLSLDDWLQQRIIPIQNLLSLATDQPNALTELSIYTVLDPTEQESNDSEQARLNTQIQVVFQPHFTNSDTKPPYQHDMLFTFSDLESDLSNLLTKWLTISDSLQTVCSLYFSTRYNPGKYLESRFLSIAQAVELYHRLHYNNTVFSKQEFNKRKRLILESVPTDYQEWLEAQLANSNEPRLSRRIEELYDLAEDVIQPLYQDKNTFIGKVRDTRNYYTHYSSNLRKKAARGIELYWLTEGLSYLLIRCFLHELGFSSERCVALFKRNRKYLNATRQIRRYYETKAEEA